MLTPQGNRRRSPLVSCCPLCLHGRVLAPFVPATSPCAGLIIPHCPHNCSVCRFHYPFLGNRKCSAAFRRTTSGLKIAMQKTSRSSSSKHRRLRVKAPSLIQLDLGPRLRRLLPSSQALGNQQGQAAAVVAVARTLSASSG